MIVRELLARLGIQVDGSGFVKAENALKGLSVGFLKLEGLALAAKAALLAMVDATAEQARAIDNAARITGMSTDQLQALGYAAKTVGVSAEEMQHGLVHLARAAQETANGSQEASAAFYQLGITATDADGKARPISDLLNELSQKFSRMPDGTQKAALAMQVFGRAGAELIPLLDKGPAGIAALTVEARRLGVVMGGPTLAAAAKYRDAMRQMRGAIGGVHIAISERLFPAFARSATQFGAWISSHRQWIALGVEKAFDAVSRVLHGLVTIGQRVVRVFELLWNRGAGMKLWLIELGAVIAGLTAPWMTLIAVMALVAEDIEGYFEGKNSVTGRVIYGLQRMMKELDKQWDLFKDDPFGNLRKWASEFATWFADKMVDALQTAPGRALQRTIDDSSGTIGKWSNLIDFGFSPAPQPFVPKGYSGPTAGPGITPPDFGQGISNVLGHFLGATAVEPRLVPYGASAASPYAASSGASRGAEITIGELHLHGADGADDPKGFAEQLAGHLDPLIDAHWSKKMRETSGAVDR